MSTSKVNAIGIRKNKGKEWDEKRKNLKWSLIRFYEYFFILINKNSILKGETFLCISFKLRT